MNKLIILVSIIFPLGSLCVVETEYPLRQKGLTCVPKGSMRLNRHQPIASDYMKPPVIIDDSNKTHINPSK